MVNNGKTNGVPDDRILNIRASDAKTNDTGISAKISAKTGAKTGTKTFKRDSFKGDCFHSPACRGLYMGAGIPAVLANVERETAGPYG